jgi:hypothetical protein
LPTVAWPPDDELLEDGRDDDELPGATLELLELERGTELDEALFTEELLDEERLDEELAAAPVGTEHSLLPPAMRPPKVASLHTKLPTNTL